MGLVAIFTAMLEIFSMPTYAVSDETSRLLAAIMGGCAQGLTGIMLRVGGSAGGVDVIACMILHKKQSENVERIIAILSYVIAVFSFFVWGDVNAVIFSIIAIFACEKMTAVVLNDSRSAVKTDGFMYDDAVSFAWTRENEVLLHVQIIDKYFGNMSARFCFKGNEVYAVFQRNAECFLTEYQGELKGVK